MKQKAYMVIALAITIFSASVASAQSNNGEQTVNFSTMSDTELKALFERFPWMVGVYQSSKGQDIDLTTIGLEENISRPNKPDTTITKVWWELRAYTGPRMSIEVGGSADFNLATGSTIGNRYGGAASIGIGYTQRRWGVDVFAGLNTIGTVEGRELGFWNFFFEPYITPFRSRDELRRCDIGAIVGVQQAPAEVFVTYDGEHWGSNGMRSTQPRGYVGGFVKWQPRIFKSRNAFSLKLQVGTYQAKARYESYADNVTTGEVYVDISEKVVERHFEVKLSATWDISLNGLKSNIPKKAKN